MPRFEGELVKTGGRFGGILVERAMPTEAPREPGKPDLMATMRTVREDLTRSGAPSAPGAPPPAPDTALETFGQNVAEVGKGIVPGAIQLGGTALKGVAAGKVASDRFQFEIVDTLRRAGSLTPKQIKDVRAKAARILAPWRDTIFRADLLRALAGDDPEDAIKRHYPDTIGAEIPKVAESAIYEAGQAVGKFGQELIPAAPGYEQSLGRTLGEGLGSMVGGAALSMVGGPLVAATAFTFAGSGEAVERAIQEGATEEQIIEAARLGVFPGMTDSLPVEVLTGRIPLPGGKLIKIAAENLGPALKIAGRIGWQAIVEGLQEGGQAWLQNLIAREVYKPEQSLTEGMLPEGGLGAGVGAIAETLATPFRRRGGGRTAPPEGPPPAPQIVPQPGRTSASEQQPPGPETQPLPAPTVYLFLPICLIWTTTYFSWTPRMGQWLMQIFEC